MSRAVLSKSDGLRLADIIRLLGDRTDMNVAASAATVLGTLADREPRFRDSVDSALTRYLYSRVNKPAYNSVKKRDKAILKALRNCKKCTAKLVRKLLQGECPAEAFDTVKGFGEDCLPGLESVLKVGCDKFDGGVLVRIPDLLWEIGGTRAIAALGASIRHDHPVVGRKAARNIARFGAEADPWIEDIKWSLVDSQVVGRGRQKNLESYIVALGDIGTEKAAQRLLTLLKKEQEKSKVIYALAKCKSRKASQALTKLVKEDDGYALTVSHARDCAKKRSKR